MKLKQWFAFYVMTFLSTIAMGQFTHEPLPCLQKKFGIIVHVVYDYNGNPNITETEIQTKIDGVNAIFDSICIAFEICEFRYISNYNYDEFSPNEFPLMEAAYCEANRINLFFTGAVAMGEGYATLGGIDSLSSGGLVAAKTFNSGDIAHLFGHFFGLYNTWEGSQFANAELADGSNCASAGDSICDTPADPFYLLSGFPWLSLGIPDFIYQGLDANGDYFNPLVGNIMSNYPHRCFFTYGQYRKMVDVWLSSSQKMW
ncbi:MAG: hypothetical protein R3279_05170 [Putridiphycobacter sp.]|nr:hypothetical protein [Putridiphycobacter sp.]